MDIKPIPTLSEEVNDIRTRTANIVAEHIIPNEKDIYSGGDKSKSLREDIRQEVKKAVSYTHLRSPRDKRQSRMPSSA